MFSPPWAGREVVSDFYWLKPNHVPSCALCVPGPRYLFRITKTNAPSTRSVVWTVSYLLITVHRPASTVAGRYCKPYDSVSDSRMSTLFTTIITIQKHRKQKQPHWLIDVTTLCWTEINIVSPIFQQGCMYCNCLGSLVVLSATATLEVLGSIPRSGKKCYWVFLWNSQ